MSVDLAAAFGAGLAVGLLVAVLGLALLNRRVRSTGRLQLEQYEQTILDLRQERSEGREANRRLRHELAISTPHHLDRTREDLQLARAEAERLVDRLTETSEELAARDRSLREARLAIQEIRQQIESGSLPGVTEAVLAEGLDGAEQVLATDAIPAGGEA